MWENFGSSADDELSAIQYAASASKLTSLTPAINKITHIDQVKLLWLKPPIKVTEQTAQSIVQCAQCMNTE